MPRQRVGEYELLEQLGTGTVGSAYRARHRETGELAAVKLLQSHVSGDMDIQRRFVREVSICQRLDHPNIVHHLDCGIHDDHIYFAMELVNCGTLKDVLNRRRTLPWREAAEVAVQVCAALEHAHAAGVIHRDLKPANLFLSDAGQVKIGDFGLARDLQGSRLTMEGQTVGTCRYMPPEQICGETELTGAVDLYALGCMLFEMLVGRTPFGGETVVGIFEQHLTAPVPRIAPLVPDCPDDFDGLVAQLLAKDPLERPASAAVVRRALIDILHGRPIDLQTPGSQDNNAGDDNNSIDAAPTQPNLTERLHALADREGGSRIRVVLIAVAVVAAAVAALLVWQQG